MTQTTINPFSEQYFQDGTPFDGYKKQLKQQGMETDFYNEFGKGFVPGSPEPTPQSPRYLTFTANEDDCTIAIAAYIDAETENYVPFTYNMEYSLDNGETWNPYEVYIEGWESPKNVSSENEGGRREGKAEAGKENEENDGEDTQTNEPYVIELDPNESVLFRGHNATLSYGTIEEEEPVIIQGFYFQTGGKGYFTASGDVTSLLNGIGGNVALTTTLEMSYLFSECRNLVTVPSLPSTTLAPYCYQYMFDNCTGLTTAPELPATTLADYCYAYMFRDCTGLTTAPELPATTLVEGCYEGMFEGCTGLEKAPDLNAPIVQKDSYKKMFEDCENLNEVKAMFETEPEEPITTGNGGKSGEEPEETITYPYTEDWLKGVSQTGTFIMSASATWESDGTASTIPDGWTIQTTTE